jgi:2-polyprenyl-6-methoxyphenol hydroxylase-like FAD-dependent oxidoreductase
LRVRAQEQIRHGFLVAGNAAHGLHPVAGQGLNLSLRDSLALAKVLGESVAQRETLGSVATLRRYEQAVTADQIRTVAATDTLATLFSRGVWGLNAPRDMALAGLDLLPPLRRWVARQGTAADRRLVQPAAMTSAELSP